MLYVLVAFVLIVAILFLALLAGKQAPVQGSRPIEYVRRDLMTPAELKFYQVLASAASGMVVAPQVAMSALMDVKSSRSNSGRQFSSPAIRGKISQKRLDFVVFDAESGKIHSVVELDDSTHQSAAAKARDAERDAMLTATGYRVIRVKVASKYDVESLRKTLLS